MTAIKASLMAVFSFAAHIGFLVKFVILNEAKVLMFHGTGKKQVLRFAQRKSDGAFSCAAFLPFCADTQARTSTLNLVEWKKHPPLAPFAISIPNIRQSHGDQH